MYLFNIIDFTLNLCFSCFSDIKIFFCEIMLIEGDSYLKIFLSKLKILSPYSNLRITVLSYEAMLPY